MLLSNSRHFGSRLKPSSTPVRPAAERLVELLPAKHVTAALAQQCVDRFAPRYVEVASPVECWMAISMACAPPYCEVLMGLHDDAIRAAKAAEVRARSKEEAELRKGRELEEQNRASLVEHAMSAAEAWFLRMGTETHPAPTVLSVSLKGSPSVTLGWPVEKESYRARWTGGHLAVSLETPDGPLPANSLEELGSALMQKQSRGAIGHRESRKRQSMLEPPRPRKSHLPVWTLLITAVTCLGAWLFAEQWSDKIEPNLAGIVFNGAAILLMVLLLGAACASS